MIHDRYLVYLARSNLAKKYLIIHYIICSLGLLIFSYKLSTDLGKTIANYFGSSIHYYEWVRASVETGKPSEMLGYIFPAICLFFYYGLAFVYLNYSVKFRNRSFLESVTSSYNIYLYFFILILINIYPSQLAINMNHFTWVIFLVTWCLFFLYPLGIIDFSFLSSMANRENHNSIQLEKSILNINFDQYLPLSKISCCLSSFQIVLKKIDNQLSTKRGIILGGILLCSLSAQIWLTFMPYLVSMPHIHNDYLGIPEQTKSNSGYIDNLDYINQHRLGGLLETDPRLFKNPIKLKAGEDYIKISKSRNLIRFISVHPGYIYDEGYQGLFVDGLLSEKSSIELCQAVAITLECQRINQFYKFNSSQGKRQYSDEELNFLQKNMYEFGNQLAIGHYFLHQAALLGSINEYSLGKPQSHIVSLYGWLNTRILAGIINYVGGLNFSNYIKVTYVFYPLYYTMIILAALIIFRNVWYALFIGLLCVGSLFLISFEGVYMAPGFNPVRHFFDVFVLVFFYYYLFANKKNSIFLGLTVFFSVLTYLCDTEFGLFVIAGLALSLFVKMMINIRKNFIDLLIVLTGLIVITAFSFLVKSGKNPAGLYYILGIMLPITSVSVISASLLILSVIYILLVFYNWRDDRWRIFLCYLFGFSQLSLVYYIWNPSPNHFYSMIFPWAFLIVVLFHETFNFGFFKEIRQIIIVFIGFLFFVLYYTPGKNAYYQNQQTNQNVFKDHKLYFWGMPRAHFLSTMDPGPFINAIGLINKYSKSNGIYIISRYDNFLPFLAAKYSLMPFTQVAPSLITDKELQISVDSIVENKPSYLFVDTNILSNHRGAISRVIDPAFSVYNLSRTHYLAFDVGLSNLFKMVASNYELVESGQLISVYKLKQ